MANVALRHILLKNKSLAEELHKELVTGASFAILAREYSICPSAYDGGFSGYHRIEMLPEPIQAVLAQADEFDQTNYPTPIQTHLGFHLLALHQTN